MESTPAKLTTDELQEMIEKTFEVIAPKIDQQISEQIASHPRNHRHPPMHRPPDWLHRIRMLQNCRLH